MRQIDPWWRFWVTPRGQGLSSHSNSMQCEMFRVRSPGTVTLPIRWLREQELAAEYRERGTFWIAGAVLVLTVGGISLTLAGLLRCAGAAGGLQCERSKQKGTGDGALLVDRGSLRPSPCR